MNVGGVAQMNGLRWWRRELRAIRYERSDSTTIAPWLAVVAVAVVALGRWLWGVG